VRPGDAPGMASRARNRPAGIRPAGIAARTACPEPLPGTAARTAVVPRAAPAAKIVPGRRRSPAGVATRTRRVAVRSTVTVIYAVRGVPPRLSTGCSTGPRAVRGTVSGLAPTPHGTPAPAAGSAGRPRQPRSSTPAHHRRRRAGPFARVSTSARPRLRISNRCSRCPLFAWPGCSARPRRGAHPAIGAQLVRASATNCLVSPPSRARRPRLPGGPLGASSAVQHVVERRRVRPSSVTGRSAPGGGPVPPRWSGQRGIVSSGPSATGGGQQCQPGHASPPPEQHQQPAQLAAGCWSQVSVLTGSAGRRSGGLAQHRPAVGPSPGRVRSAACRGPPCPRARTSGGPGFRGSRTSGGAGPLHRRGELARAPRCRSGASRSTSRTRTAAPDRPRCRPAERPARSLRPAPPVLSCTVRSPAWTLTSTSH